MDPEPVSAVADRVYRITVPLPFRPRSVHAYLVGLEGGRWLLVDGGIDTEAAWAALDAGVRRVAGGWSAIAAHLVTHMHVDHLGLAARVREASGAPLLMGRLDAERAAHAAAHPAEEAEYRARLLAENGAPAALVEALQRDRAAADPPPGHAPATHALAEDTAPLPGANAWLSVWTPGHTAGHTSLFRPSDRLLIAGDAVLPRVTPTIGVNRQRADPVRDYLEALDRVAGLEPARILPGHGDPIEAPAARVEELRRATRDETERIRALLGAGPATAWQLASARYRERELPTSARVQALRETRAHLDHLEASGRARRERRAGVVRFWPL